jgi:AcrR family transcriptional regulator
MKTLTCQSAKTERHEAILRAAADLFAAKGYQAVSTEEIARAAGVSKGLVHYHFSSKAVLLQQVMLDSFATISNQLEAISRTEMTARAKIRATVLAYIQHGNRQLSLIQGLHLAGPAAMDEATHAQVHGLMEREKLELTRLVEDGIATGEFRRVDSRLTVSILLGAIRELIVGAAMAGEPVAADRAADEVTSLFCDGVGR